MDHFLIRGRAKLCGTIEVSGSKNASLPAMAACLMSSGSVRLHGVPVLSDIDSMTRLLTDLGMQIDREDPRDTGLPGHPRLGGAMTLSVRDEALCEPCPDVSRSMRASISVLGPLLAKRGRAVLRRPGGCVFGGDRPFGLHLKGLEALGAKFHQEAEGVLVGEAPSGLRGATIFLGGPAGPTVLGTINVMCAAVLARGRTRIVSAACEPEVVDVARLLNRMGAHVVGAGTPEITIEGVEKLSAAEHTVIPDRIEAGTFMIASAITGGDVVLRNVEPDHLIAVMDVLESAGVIVSVRESSINAGRMDVRVVGPDRVKAVDFVTWPYPGFPTDLQAPMMSMLAIADGKSKVVEHIYNQRFGHVAELMQMGGQIDQTGSTAWVSGVGTLVAATVKATDLRASAGLLLAGLVAAGSTRLERVDYLDRGYEKVEQKLGVLGADVTRIPAKPKLSTEIHLSEPTDKTASDPGAASSTATDDPTRPISGQHVA